MSAAGYLAAHDTTCFDGDAHQLTHAVDVERNEEAEWPDATVPWRKTCDDGAGAHWRIVLGRTKTGGHG